MTTSAVLILDDAEVFGNTSNASGRRILQAITAAGALHYAHPAFMPGEPGERTFNLEIPDAAAQELCARLTAMPGVEACYLKPPDEPP